MRATFIMGAALLLVLAACETGTQIEGHKIRATAGAVTKTVAVSDGVHEHAPAWFKGEWREYLRRIEGSYGVLALDTQARGSWYIYCNEGPACRTLDLGSAKSFSEVNYKHGALKGCRARVRRNHPTVVPDCSIYAIKDKIVWQGPMPWPDAGTYEGAPVAATPEPGRTTAHQRTLTLSWVGSTDLLTATLDIAEGKRSGSIATVMEGRDCKGRYWFTNGLHGQWKVDCGDGWLTMSGDFTANSGPKGGGRGTGTDNHGRLVEFVVDPIN